MDYRIICLMCAMVLGAVSYRTVANAMPIDTVQVRLTAADGAVLPAAMVKRMSAGIRVAEEHILLGKDAEIVERQMPAYQQVSKDIIDRILYGYTVNQLKLTPGSQTMLDVEIVPYGEVVRQVKVSIDYGNLTATARAMVEHDTAGVNTRAEQILSGLSLDSLDWAGGVAESAIRDALSDQLPEFISQVEVTPGETTEVKIYLIPQGTIVRHGDTEIQSRTLPTGAFIGTKRKFDGYLKQFYGLPVAFMARHRQDIIDEIQQELKNSRAVRQFSVTMEPTVNLGESVQLIIHTNSSRYIVRGEGYLDMGHEDNSLGLKLYTGIRQGKHDLYLETEFIPENYHWHVYPTYAYHVTDQTVLGYRYNWSDNDHRLWVSQDVGGRWHIRALRDFKIKRNEFAVAYDLHSYLTVEYIVDCDENWLRLVSHI